MNYNEIKPFLNTVAEQMTDRVFNELSRNGLIDGCESSSEEDRAFNQKYNRTNEKHSKEIIKDEVLASLELIYFNDLFYEENIKINIESGMREFI